MIAVYSRNKVPIRFTKERWKHIRERHPEMETQSDRILETVKSPDCIQQGDFGELLAIRQYLKTPLTTKFLIVAYREMDNEDGFIVTAYFTSRISSKRIMLWKR